VGLASFSRDGRLIVTTAGKAGARLWDAGTGEPVSPPFYQAGGVGHATFSPDGRSVITAGLDPIVRLWTLQRDERPSADCTSLAQLLAGSRIDPGSVLAPLDHPVLSNQWQTLRAKYPLEFAPFTDRAPR